MSELLAAIYSGRRDAVAAILATHPSLDIFEAAAVGDERRVRELLERDPSLANAYATDGFQPLGLAAFFRHPGVVRLLIDRGADVSSPARHKLRVTALHSAVATDAAPVDHAIVRMLLDAGAPANLPHLGGGTPLHTAAFVGDVESARLLLRRGADPTQRTDEGKTAVAIARERGHTDLAAMLERRSSA